MKKSITYILLFITLPFMVSCGDKVDEEKYRKLEDLRETLTEYYDKLENLNMMSEQYDSLKVVFDSLYTQKKLYKQKIDSALIEFDRLKEDVKRLNHNYFPTALDDITNDIEEIRTTLEEGLQWNVEETDI